MAKNRELASVVSSKVWRTIVVAGAMLGAPIVVGCGGGNKPAPAAPDKTASEPDNHGIDNDAATSQAKFEADAEAKAAADKAAADQVAADQAAADAKAQADKDAVDQAATDAALKKKKRPRTNNSRPSGRGFILS
jgi:hypothetical protein